jgi:hypothetical protein
METQSHVIESRESGGVAPPAADATDVTPRWDRWMDTAIVVILALASLLAAWSGYQAGLWNEQKSGHIIEAEARQIDATRATMTGYQIRQIDVTIFLAWLDAFMSDDTELAGFYQARFTPQLEVAFAAWQATDPLTNSESPTDPIRMPEYQVPALVRAAELDAEVHLAYAEAEHDGAVSDAYVFSTLLLAVVLFFGGVCTKIGWRPAQLGLLLVTAVLLIYSVSVIGGLPDGSAWDLTPLWG